MDNAAVNRAGQFLRHEYPDIPIPKKSYLVLMTARSGSTLLCAHLEKIGYGRPIEAFNANHNPMFRNVWDIDYNDPYAYVKTAIEFQTVNGVFGMKLNLNHFKLFLKHARQLLQPASLDLTDAEVVEVFFPGVCYIHLQRRDKVKQAISYAKAWQNGIWYESDEMGEEYKEYLLPVVYDREHIECCLDLLLATESAWQSYLTSNGIQSLNVWYEDLVQNYASGMKEIYRFLGIHEREVSTPPLRKQANRESDVWEQRFLAETAWVNDPQVREKMNSGDITCLWLDRGLMIARQNEQARWKRMPANRLKPLRNLVFRVIRKIKSLIGKENNLD